MKIYHFKDYIQWSQDVASTREGQNSSLPQKVSSAMPDGGLDPCSCAPCDYSNPDECPSTLVIPESYF